MLLTQPRAAAVALFFPPLMLAACRGPVASAPSAFPGSLQEQGAAEQNTASEEDQTPFWKEVLVELSVTPRSGADDDVYGIAMYTYPDSAWGFGMHFQSTVSRTNPELDVVLVAPAAELEPRTTEFVADLVATRRLSPTFGVFAGAGIAYIEDYRRFVDAIGNDFFVSDDRDVRGNVTAGAHFWILDSVTLSAQWDSIFESATFAVGWQF